MPLQSSGAISLNDIQTEFGGTNPININEYYRGGGLVPNTSVNINIPTSGTISLSNFYGASKLRGFITSLFETGAQGLGVAVDSSANVYVCGSIFTTNNNCIIAKYNSSGTIQWQRTLSGAGTEIGRAIAVDSSANVYVAGVTNSQSAGGNDALIVKYNTNGVIQWQVTLGGTSADQGYGVAVDSSANVYVCGSTSSVVAGNTQMFIAKYNTNGALLWQRAIGGSGIEIGYDIAVDSSGNCYVAGYTSTSGGGGGGADAYIVKYNTSGTLQWQRSVGTSSTDFTYGIGVDSSGNVYISGDTRGTGVAGGGDGFIAEYNTNGLLQWQRCFGNTADNYFSCLAVDSAGNSYVAGYTTSVNCIMAKYSDTGILQWQRSLSVMNFGWGITVDSVGNYYVTGQGTSLIITVKFPGDGSATGTYGSYTYSALTYTSASISVTSFTPTYNEAAGTLSSVTRTLTDAASSLVSTTTTI